MAQAPSGEENVVLFNRSVQMLHDHGRHLAWLAVLALAGAVPANAATITDCGPNVCYEYDNAQAAVALTGLPSLVGDDMRFLPPAFRAQSSGGAGWVTATASFVFARVYTVDPNDEIATFHTAEELDYEIVTDGQVSATLYTRALSNILLTDDTSTTVNWGPVNGDTGGAQVDDIAAYLYPAAMFAAAANDLQITIENTIRAYTDALAEDAFVQKKFTLSTVTRDSINVVPVPAAVWLFGSALGLIGGIRRRAVRGG